MRVADTSSSGQAAGTPESMPLRPLAGGILALAIAMGIGRFAYTPLLPRMQEAAHLNAGAAGFLASANFAGYLAGALLLTLVSPGGARSRLLGASLITVAATTALMAATTNIGAWSVIRFVAGAASAAVFILASEAVLAIPRPEIRSAVAGRFYSGVGAGIVASGLVAHILTGPDSWRYGWLVLGLLAAAAVYPAWRWLSPPEIPVTPAARTRALRMPQLTLPLALLVTAYTLAGAGYIVTGTFLVAIVEKSPGLTGIGAGVWIVVGLAVIPLTPLWGVAGARLGYVPALTLAYLVQACAIVLPVLGGSAVLAFGSAVLFGGTFMALAALTMTLARHIVPGSSTGAIGLLTLGFSGGQIVGPVLSGLAAGHFHSFRPALVAAAAAVLLAGALIATLGRHRGEHAQPGE